RYPPQREPALVLLLDRELAADLGLEDELALDVALLLAVGRHERVEETALVVVDPVQLLLLLVLKSEHRAQDPVAVAAPLQRAADRVDPHHQTVEVLPAEDQPSVAVA